MGKSTISITIFNSYFDITRGYHLSKALLGRCFSTICVFLSSRHRSFFLCMPDILISSKNNEYIMGENGSDLFLNKTCLVGYVGIYPLVIKHGHRKSPIATVKKTGFLSLLEGSTFHRQVCRNAMWLSWWWLMNHDHYTLVMTNIAIENGHL